MMKKRSQKEPDLYNPFSLSYSQNDPLLKLNTTRFSWMKLGFNLLGHRYYTNIQMRYYFSPEYESNIKIGMQDSIDPFQFSKQLTLQDPHVGDYVVFNYSGAAKAISTPIGSSGARPTLQNWNGREILGLL